MANFAFVTLCSNEEYVPGALVWAQSLRQQGTAHKIVIMVTSELSLISRKRINALADEVFEVDSIDSRDYGNLELLGRPELGITFTKLHCWRLKNYTKCVFMDADTMVLQNIDDLFERDEFSASPDPGWPDCFNSGVFVFSPSLTTYSSLIEFAAEHGSFDGGDQGLLNMYFSDWASSDSRKRLPFVYNCVSQAFYSYLPAMRYFRNQIRVAHFIGPVKPWHHEVSEETGLPVSQSATGFSDEFLQRWWDIYNQLTPNAEIVKGEERAIQEICGTSSPVELPSSVDPPVSRSDRERQYAWERGEIDYLGDDRFLNIMEKIQTGIKDDSKPGEDE